MSLSLSDSARRQWRRAFPTLFRFAQLALSAVTANAQSTSPFAKFFGTWRGVGSVLMADGSDEKIRCTATYSAESGGRSLSQALVCASDSYRVDIRSFIVADGQAVQGHWEESVRQAAGHLEGQIVGGQVEGTISGPGFEAGMSLVTSGIRQTILISPVGGSISRVQIALSRQG
ncbi:MAG: hypothetical protein ABSG83_02065 [Roseiarcus sp.]